MTGGNYEKDSGKSGRMEKGVKGRVFDGSAEPEWDKLLV